MAKRKPGTERPEGPEELYDETAEQVGRFGIPRRLMSPTDVLMEKAAETDEDLFLLAYQRVQADAKIAELIDQLAEGQSERASLVARIATLEKKK